MVETVKRILTKERIDRQLAGQSSTTPFMSVKEIYSKWVTFDTQDRLEGKIDKLKAMMDKLAAKDSEVNRPFKPQMYQSKRRGQGGMFMIHIIMTEETIKIGTYQMVETGEFSLTDKVEVGLGMIRTIGQKILEAVQSYIKFLEERIVEENTKGIIETKITAQREVEVGLEKVHFQEIIIIEGMIESQVIADQGKVQE